MIFNIAHNPPTQQALYDTGKRISKHLHIVRIRMMAAYVVGALSCLLGAFAAVLLTGTGVANVPSQLIFISTIAVIGGVVYSLFKNTADAENLESKLDDLRPVEGECCELSELSAEYPIVEEYRAAVAAQQRHMVFGEYQVIRDWFESKHGMPPGHKAHIH